MYRSLLCSNVTLYFLLYVYCILQHDLEEEVAKGQNEIRVLKDRLLMCRDEYKAKVIECYKLTESLQKLNKAGILIMSSLSTMILKQLVGLQNSTLLFCCCCDFVFL